MIYDKTQAANNPIKALRYRLRMTQREFARAIGFTAGNVSQVELGRTPGIDYAKACVELAKKNRVRLTLDMIYADREGIDAA